MANEQDRNLDRDRDRSQDKLDQPDRSQRASSGNIDQRIQPERSSTSDRASSSRTDSEESAVGYRSQPRTPDGNVDERSGIHNDRSSRDRNSKVTDAG